MRKNCMWLVEEEGDHYWGECVPERKALYVCALIERFPDLAEAEFGLRQAHFVSDFFGEVNLFCKPVSERAEL